MLSLWTVIKESFLLSFGQLRNNKLRTGLSLLGVTIGIFSIIAILTAVDALKNDISGSINKLGNNLIFVGRWPWAFNDTNYPWWNYWKRPEASYDDFLKLQGRLTKAEAVSYSVYPSASNIKFNNEAVENIDVVGATQEIADVFDYNINAGRFFSVSESNLGLPVAVIGGGIAETLSGNTSNLLGKEIFIFGQKVKIIGIIKKEGQGGLLGMNNDKDIILPYLFVNKVTHLELKEVSPRIIVKAQQGVSLSELEFEIQQKMRSIRRLRPIQDDNFALNRLSIIAQGFEGIFYVLNIIGWVIGFFALIVGGFGIANIMYVSVSERTNIIGIKKALGAKKIYILLEFLFESILLCFWGGLLGLVIVYLLSFPVSSASGMSFVLSFKNGVIGISIAMLIGLLSGYLPARKAADLDPVEAIRTV
ncbi:MAG: ABC transporter permease [Chitinophagales bacterium]|nr:ABC transporter permease [Chitinophagales bacterium]